LGISPQTVITHLHEGRGMKCFHLRWVPLTLIDLHKANRVRHAQAMIRALDNHLPTGCKYLQGVQVTPSHLNAHEM
jgi:hypothetical protein